ncbi:hypothetical protein BU52_00730 [Streptomyces toyocaensis]|uniref:Uncharacterized protein n=1 Tax=Streptomyces toyocaensis TaxID=55952 RepID=A0A081XYI0_STRTO|nr:hypothetical protein BU52_00730 [Streptomyces toyocaensis]
MPGGRLADHRRTAPARIVLDSGIPTGCVVAVLLNVVSSHLGTGRREASEVTHPREPGEELTGAKAPATP